jgi:hypothetical protein
MGLSELKVSAVKKAAIFVLASMTCFVGPAAAAPKGNSPSEARIALVIGNGSYSNVPLKNPANDARDVAAALKKLGFSVSLVVDGDMAAMSRAIRDFGAAIRRPDAVALFYYSGHGVQYRGANYLLPAKSDIQDPDELAFSAVNAELIYAKMESSGDKTNIVVLDACRNNPFPGAERASERGLAVVGNIQPPQSLIVYATAPGKTAQDGEGRNGVFSAALLKHLGDPGLDVELMFRRVRDEVIAATEGAQVPWTNSSISGKGFAFAPAAELPAVAVVPAKPAAPAPRGGAARNTGSLKVTSEPSGMDVSVDDAAPLKTPFKLDLPPGSHSVEPQRSIIERMYYEGEKKKWVNVEAGTEALVPLSPEPAQGKLLLKLVPEGYAVFVNGEKVGDTPLGELNVQAGLLAVRLEREGEAPRLMPYGLQPGETATLQWGTTRDTALQLARASIKLEAKGDSWAGIEPVYEQAKSSFMGSEAYGVKSFYLCRDDKYLYLRVDFRETNPFDKKPKGMNHGIVVQVRFWFEETKKDFQMNLTYVQDTNKMDCVLGSYDGAARKWNKLADNAVTLKQGKDLLVARLDWTWIDKYCKGIGQPAIQMANVDDRWRWMDQVDLITPRYVDFAK